MEEWYIEYSLSENSHLIFLLSILLLFDCSPHDFQQETRKGLYYSHLAHYGTLNLDSYVLLHLPFFPSFIYCQSLFLDASPLLLAQVVLLHFQLQLSLDVTSSKECHRAIIHKTLTFNVSQYLNCVICNAYLQELKRIPNHKDQGTECKNQEVMGHRVQKGPCAKGPNAAV